jgi:hypothetical protein
MTRIVYAAAAVLIVAGCAGSADEPSAESVAKDAQTPLVQRTVDAAVSVRRGGESSIYEVRGINAVIGNFVGMCSRQGVAQTAYDSALRSANAVVAVDGRGVSRAAGTLLAGETLRGGRDLGLESWLVRMGRSPEEVTVQADLAVYRSRGSRECGFWLYGSLSLLRS